MLKTYFRIPLAYLSLIILGFLLQNTWSGAAGMLALFPRNPAYLTGIITTVFLHSSMEHLASNFLPLSACLFGLFYFYGDIAAKVTVLCHVITGVLIWIFARPSFHIGASGLAYALVFFILVSGFTRKNRRLMVLAFATLVFQSGLIWGIFPQDNLISWESHLLGAVTGTMLAIAFRKQGPEPDKPLVWEEDEEEEEDEYEKLNP